MASPYQAFGLSCPAGGNFYICENSSIEFIGCCTDDACSASNDGNCTKTGGKLKASSFSADAYQDLPTQDCADSRGKSIWWTCKFNTPPFMGCCSSNPCAAGECLSENLVPARLSDNARLKASFLSPEVSATPTVVSTKSISSTQATITHSSSTSTTGVAQASDRPQSPSGGGLSGGAIGGIAAAAAIVIILIIAGMIYRCGWYAPKKEEQMEGSRAPGAMSQNLSGHGEGQGMDVNQYRGSYFSGSTAEGPSPSKFSQHPSLAPDGSSWHYLGGSDQGSPLPQFQQYPGSDDGSPPQQFPPNRSHGHSHSGSSSHPFLSPVAELGDATPRQELPTEYHNYAEPQRSPPAQKSHLEPPYLSTVMPSTPAYEAQGTHHNTVQPQFGGIYSSHQQY